METVYVFLGILAVLFIKPLVWTPLLFLLDRLAGLVGPRFRAKVSGHYAGKPMSYFYFAQSLGPTVAQQGLDQKVSKPRP